MGTTNLDSLSLTGSLTAANGLNISGGSVALPANSLGRAALVTENAIFRQSLQLFRTITGLVLDATGGAALHKIVAGAFGTGTMELRGNDASSNTVTSTSSFEFVLPEGYVSGGAITLRINAKTSGGGTITVQTVDAEVFKCGTDGTAGSDICATNIQTMTQSAIDYNFTITPTGLVAGDKLRINIQQVLTITNATATRSHIHDVVLICAIKG